MTPDFSHTSLDSLNALGQNTAVAHLGIEFIEIGTDYLKARMPVDARTRQPAGLLHGGASALLAETLGSVAGNLCVDTQKQICVGLEINANHVRSARSGWVYGAVRPVHVGRSTQVWDIRIVDEADKLVCASRLTLAVMPRPDRALVFQLKKRCSRAPLLAMCVLFHTGPGLGFTQGFNSHNITTDIQFVFSA